MNKAARLSNLDPLAASPPVEALLRIDGLTVDLPAQADRRHAVQGVDLTLSRDEILCIVGESGSGKSVMSRSVLGLFPSRHVQPSAGRILFNGEDLLTASPERLRELRGNRIAMIFQEPMTALNPVIKIGQQIDEVMKVHTQEDRAVRRARVLEMLTAVNLPDPARVLDAYPHQLSGGQRQRAMIAMALVLEPDILIADEPTTALDVTTQAQILALIREVQAKRRMGVMFITHDFGVVAEIADRIMVMRHGKVVEHGLAEAILESPKDPYTRALLAAVPSIVPAARRNFDGAPTVLRVNGVSKIFRSGGGLLGSKARQVHALKSVNFAIRRGETLGIVGESGSGKSTLARCVIRLLQADEGEIRVDEVDIASLSGLKLRSMRRRIQMVFQDPYGSLNPRRTVGQLIAEGPMVHGVGRDVAWARMVELLELVGLDKRAAERFPHEFSGGQRQRVGLARALALEPDILVADEPVSALDVSVQDQVLRLLSDIRERLGLTVLFITHDLRVASQVCDSVAVMRYGEIVEMGAVDQIYSDPQHAYTKELLNAVPGRQWSLGRAAMATE
ncbi:ABC transporter ATP-binding protein [Paralcaligenes ureilyticus]|uniref:Peptide/nickel transport system ATP-binding protein n=1 Tax=Paralcaligenes ureilyticus TaxID=627131 RepID=A0A4R3LLR3_9BURK|nr:ABC transporter ATP-binding protein [Paralcaligenes ureilyticus]TCT00536.1 peptide/nickel transport system ATP-binding protein [Paralcaligenes ureilyticus]